MDLQTLSTLLDLLFFPTFIFIVFTVHEFGHYAAARFFNIGVESYTLGYGREIWSKKDKHGTRWSVRWLPLSGHVHLADNKKQAKGVPFSKAPRWQRILTVAAGPAINIIFAFLVLCAFFIQFGQPSKAPVIAGVEPGQPGYEAGLRTDDRIIAVNGMQVERYKEVRALTYPLPPQELEFTIKRGEEIYKTTLTPAVAEYIDTEGLERAHGRMGVMIGRIFMSLGVARAIDGIDVTDDKDKARALLLDRMGQEVTLSLLSTDDTVRDYITYISADLNAHLSDPSHEDYGSFYAGNVDSHFYLPRTVTQSLIQAGKQVGELVRTIVGLPFQLFPMDKQKVKPWAVVKKDGMFFERKLYEFCYRLALVSVFIGLLNLIPFPGLDGGVLLFLAIEGMVGPDDPDLQKVYKYVLLMAISLLYCFAMLSNVRDMPHYIWHKTQKIKEADRWPFAIDEEDESR